jgi:aspartate/methionine/tyrosine aminotransferase
MTTTTLPGASLIAELRPEARNAPESGIVEVMNHGRLKPGLDPALGRRGRSSDADFIVRAANASLAAGETFYTWQRGVPELRAGAGRYHAALYGQPFSMPSASSSPVPACSRSRSRPARGRPRRRTRHPDPGLAEFRAADRCRRRQGRLRADGFSEGRFTLDLDKLAAAITPRTRALVINSPANPTGWTATKDEMAAMLALARKHGIWIIADEIYGRFVYDGSPAQPPSTTSWSEEDRVLFVQTFSKNWAMTGWRIGWIEVPPPSARSSRT